jgi:hypothetical protein
MLGLRLLEQRQGNGKHRPRAVKAIHIGFASDHNMSAHKLYCFETKKLMAA